MSPQGLSLTLHSDGGSRGNPGPAGAGAVLYDDQGQEVAALSRYLGRTTNNEAEYQALLLGLNEAKRLGAARLTVKMDSELIVRQLEGKYRVKAPGLKPMYDQAKRLLQGFASVTILHVRREFNKRADELANQAMDQH
ncbi:MAG: ribonuclease HI family protein [Desulfarculus sp.]|nr:ribonuclease HI family protein [Pseudomonadota bacterium]MBV1717227.1 ribonuclease HI family protein [Desulfarculus sp.]MBU4576530.1 ribonuclease HI family protein [Pseudomonadota bacterium]MBU4598453.1 ribonuclease HI family protein [Pseudomonadota bacterium]MBV1737035.1 ribonuclease HI family protein [Desulfarculus sp.]